MKVKVDNKVFEYLVNNILIRNNKLKSSIKIENKDNFVFIELNEEDAILIRDKAGELLQKKGFDKNYSLTSEGEILEKIEDIFFF